MSDLVRCDHADPDLCGTCRHSVPHEAFPGFCAYQCGCRTLSIARPQPLSVVVCVTTDEQADE